MAEHPTFQVNLERVQDFEFNVSFDWEQVQPILMDEPPPLGGAKGANAARLLGAAVGNCLSASLLFCLQKAKVEVETIKTRVIGEIGRNEKGRLRVGKIDVEIQLIGAGEDASRMQRCLSIFEDYCVVTGSVRKGIPVTVRVVDESGKVLHEQSE